jgi:lipoate-protein ligase A
MMSQFSAGLLNGLDSLGIAAEFKRKNDIEVNGRKIVGLGIYRAPSNGLLFHASLLVDLDVPFMLRVLKTPFEKISDKEISMVSARTTDARRELGRDISLEEVRQTVARGYATAFNADLDHGDFTVEERQDIGSQEKKKYLTEEWIYQSVKVPDTYGAAKVKTPAGLLDVRATLAGRIVKAVFIGGDFFASENAIADLEASLRWHSSERSAIAATLAAVYGQRRSELNGIPLEVLSMTVQRAVRQAAIAERRAQSDPYGCFVTPETARV